jgi:hypothetical protein
MTFALRLDLPPPLRVAPGDSRAPRDGHGRSSNTGSARAPVFPTLRTLDIVAKLRQIGVTEAAVNQNLELKSLKSHHRSLKRHAVAPFQARFSRSKGWFSCRNRRIERRNVRVWASFAPHSALSGVGILRQEHGEGPAIHALLGVTNYHHLVPLGAAPQAARLEGRSSGCAGAIWSVLRDACFAGSSGRGVSHYGAGLGWRHCAASATAVSAAAPVSNCSRARRA